MVSTLWLWRHWFVNIRQVQSMQKKTPLKVSMIRLVHFIVNTLHLWLSRFWLRQLQTLAAIYMWNRILMFSKFKMERRLNFEGMISALILKANNQIIKLENTMPTLHKNCKENEFTGLIRHLDGSYYDRSPSFKKKYYHLYGFLYL